MMNRKLIKDSVTLSGNVYESSKYIHDSWAINKKGCSMFSQRFSRPMIIQDKAWIYHNKKTIHIGFKGSTTLEDIELAIYKTPKRIPEGWLAENQMIHSGFMWRYQMMQNNLENKIRYIIKNNNIKHIIATGHSLGGVMAIILNLHMRAHIPHNIKMSQVILGTPKFSNIDAIFDDCVNIVNINDIVTNIQMNSYSNIKAGVTINFNGKGKNIIDNHSVKLYKDFIDDLL